MISEDHTMCSCSYFEAEDRFCDECSTNPDSKELIYHKLRCTVCGKTLDKHLVQVKTIKDIDDGLNTIYLINITTDGYSSIRKECRMIFDPCKLELKTQEVV